jgi:hypothetical protein
MYEILKARSSELQGHTGPTRYEALEAVVAELRTDAAERKTVIDTALCDEAARLQLIIDNLLGAIEVVGIGLFGPTDSTGSWRTAKAGWWQELLGAVKVAEQAAEGKPEGDAPALARLKACLIRRADEWAYSSGHPCDVAIWLLYQKDLELKQLRPDDHPDEVPAWECYDVEEQLVLAKAENACLTRTSNGWAWAMPCSLQKGHEGDCRFDLSVCDAWKPLSLLKKTGEV